MINDVIEKLVNDYKSEPNVLGIVLVGSGSRYYRDSLSDYDMEVIVEDSFYNNLEKEKRFWRYRDSKIDIEFLVYPKSDFLAKVCSTADVDHWPYEECKIVYDPVCFLENNIPLIVAMDYELRTARIKLHYFEVLFTSTKVKRVLQRGDELNVRLVAGQMTIVFVKLLFLLFYKWPPILHWTSQNILGIPNLSTNIKQLLLEILRNPTIESTELLVSEIENLMESQGISYIDLKDNLTNEVGSAEFRGFREKYSLL